MKIIIDTREQKPLVFTGHKTITRKLDEGDYATEESESKIVIERKTLEDFYGSIIQGHARFKAEILRSRAKNKVFYIFLQGRIEDFISLKWSDRELKTKPETIKKMLETMIERYDLKIIECPNRTAMSKKMIELMEMKTW